MPPPKSINEIAFLTMRALSAKQSLPKLTDAITDLVKEPDSPGGRIHEDRLRKMMRDTCTAVLEQEEVDAIFPLVVEEEPPPAPDRKSSKRGSVKRSGSKVE